mgnify:CR=1 FL=1
MALSVCLDCGGAISTLAEACPKCGRPTAKKEKKFTGFCPNCNGSISMLTEICPKCATRVSEKKSGGCPVCGGSLSRMDASSRGAAFGGGSFLGAFMKTHRCSKCGYMA